MNLKLESLLRIAYLLIISSYLPCNGIEIEKLQDVLNAPVTVITQDQVNFRGLIKRIKSDELILKEYAGTGVIEYALQFDNIQRIDFPGTEYVALANEFLENKDYPHAILIMDALYKQRVQLFRWQPFNALLCFKRHAELHLNYGSLTSAIQIANQLKAHINNSGIIDELNDIILLAYHRLWMEDRADALSKQWIEERSSYGRSALGWYVQAELKLKAQDYAQALQFALEPIVFSSQFPMSYLDHCYAVAIIAAIELNESAHSQLLWKEMHERGFAWPAVFAKQEPTFDL